MGSGCTGRAPLLLGGCPGAAVVGLFPQVSVQLMKALRHPRHSVFFTAFYLMLPKLRHMKTLNLRAITEEEKRNSLRLYLRMILSCEKQTPSLTLVLCHHSGLSLCTNTATQKAFSSKQKLLQEAHCSILTNVACKQATLDNFFTQAKKKNVKDTR